MEPEGVVPEGGEGRGRGGEREGGGRGEGEGREKERGRKRGVSRIIVYKQVPHKL